VRAARAAAAARSARQDPKALTAQPTTQAAARAHSLSRSASVKPYSAGSSSMGAGRLSRPSGSRLASECPFTCDEKDHKKARVLMRQPLLRSCAAARARGRSTCLVGAHEQEEAHGLLDSLHGDRGGWRCGGAGGGATQRRQRGHRPVLEVIERARDGRRRRAGVWKRSGAASAAA
jgi:hypothetical protein